MSAEETQQPSFTVTAGGLPPPAPPGTAGDVSGRSTRQPSPSSYSSVANRYETDPGLKDVTTGKEDDEGVQTESLRQWTLSQRRANEHSADHDNRPTPDGAAEEPTVPDEANVDIANQDDRSTPELDVPEPPEDGPSDELEDDNVSTPTESATPAHEPVNGTALTTNEPSTPKRKKPSHPGPNATPAANQASLLPVNEFSPFKSRKSAPPSASKKQTGLSLKRARTTVEQDSFADDIVRPKTPPADRIARMMQRYESDTLDVPLTNGDDHNDDVPGWNASAMQGAATLVEPVQTHLAEGIEEENSPPRRSAFAVSSDHSQASQSVPLVDHDTPQRAVEESPTALYLNLSSNPTENSPVKARRFGQMLESQSSHGLPAEAPFSQYDLDESQESQQSVAPVATQSVPRIPMPASSPPPEQETHRATESQTIGRHPRHSHATGETAASSIHPRSTYSGKGTTQEPTQLVTEDELVTPVPPPQSMSPPSAVRRALPSARKLRDGKGVASFRSDRPAEIPAVARLPSTVAAPQAVQAVAQSTTGPPAALVETYVDADHDMGERGDLPVTDDAEVRPTQRALPSSRPSSPRQSALATSPIADTNEQIDDALEPTFVDPTVTSLPAPPPPRRTPKQYGRQNAVTRASPVSPTPQTLATPPPTAGPSKRAAVSRSQSPEAPSEEEHEPPLAAHRPPEPIATKSGRVSKRKRRDSSASMTGSDSSSEELDPYDESYRPASKMGSKGKARSTVVHPNLKRVKRGSRSGSTSRRISVAARPAAGASTPLTPPPTSSPPDRARFVFAYWHPNWHIGQVTGMEDGRYAIDFEDNTRATVAVDKVRSGVLRVGDKIREIGSGTKDLEVRQVWQGESDVVMVDDGRAIPLQNIYIRKAVINADFDDRMITPAEFGFDVDPTPAPSVRPPLPPPAPARSSTHGSEIFAGKVFFITSFNSDHSKVRSHQKTVAENILSNGGKVVANWEDLFDLPASGFGSTLASTSAPFLLQETDQAALTAKVLISLAKGIPCLSVTYVADAIANSNVDWRSYLIESGFSEKFNQHCSQVIDGSWGKMGWNAATAQAERRPFLNRTFLFLEPPAKYRHLKKLLLVCLHAMGAINVEVVNRLGARRDVEGYDYVLVEDRDARKQIPSWLFNESHAGNVTWLKQCLIMGAALKPGLYENKT